MATTIVIFASCSFLLAYMLKTLVFILVLCLVCLYPGPHIPTRPRGFVWPLQVFTLIRIRKTCNVLCTSLAVLLETLTTDKFNTTAFLTGALTALLYLAFSEQSRWATSATPGHNGTETEEMGQVISESPNNTARE